MFKGVSSLEACCNAADTWKNCAMLLCCYSFTKRKALSIRSSFLRSAHLVSMMENNPSVIIIIKNDYRRYAAIFIMAFMSSYFGVLCQRIVFTALSVSCPYNLASLRHSPSMSKAK